MFGGRAGFHHERRLAMRRFLFPTILGAAVLGIMGIPSHGEAQRMGQMPPPAKMQSPILVIPAFYPAPYMPTQYAMPGSRMQSYQMRSYPMPGYQMSSYPMPGYQGGSYDSYGSSQYSSNPQAS